MASALKLPYRFAVKARLYLDLFLAYPLPARRIQGLLRVHVVIQRIHDDLHMTLGLHEAAHHAEGAYRPPLARQKSRDDGMIALFAGA